MLEYLRLIPPVFPRAALEHFRLGIQLKYHGVIGGMYCRSVGGSRAVRGATAVRPRSDRRHNSNCCVFQRYIIMLCVT